MLTVLIVDGCRDLVDSLAHELEINQWRAIVVHTIDEAKSVAGGIHVDVVLTDELLPEGKGISVEEAFREDDRLRGTPFVYVVASASSTRTLQGKCVLAKPFTCEAALDKLSSAVRHARPDRE